MREDEENEIPTQNKFFRYKISLKKDGSESFLILLTAHNSTIHQKKYDIKLIPPPQQQDQLPQL